MLRRGFSAVAVALFVVAIAASSVSAAEYVPGQVIVKFRPGTTIAQQTAALAGAGAIDTGRRVSGVGAKLVRVTGDAKDAAARLSAASAVRYAEVDKILTAYAAARPNDPRFTEQYALDVINAPEGWSAAGLGGFPSTGGAKVGIIDTGINGTHPEFSGGRISNCAQSTTLFGVGGEIRSGCADTDGHGTAVAGILGARANNGIGIAGVAFNSPLAICRALEDGLGRGSTSSVVNCVNWLRNRGAKVISMSFGGANSNTLQTAVRNAWAGGRGAVLVAAAGNDGSYGMLYPAAYPEVISVAATDQADGHGGSNHNGDVELSAPGIDILTTDLDNGYRVGSGTSAATPYVAGVAAVARQKYPAYTAAQIRDRLAATADDLGATGRDYYFGFGRVNLCRAVAGAC